MRVWIILAALVVLGCTATAAFAQQPQPEQPAQPAPGAQPAQPTAEAPTVDRSGEPLAQDQGSLGGSKAASAFFWALSALVVLGSIFVITRRNMVAAVMGLVGTFFAIAALYAMLYAHFLAAIQVLVYAGAIMVLFVFVIMILNKPEDEPFALHGLLGKALAVVALVYLLFRVGEVLWAVRQIPVAAVPPPGPLLDSGDFGSTRSIGTVLFTDYLFAFEAVSVVLLVAVVGALAIARPSITAEAQSDDDAPVHP